jgi:hypothetical protein
MTRRHPRQERRELRRRPRRRNRPLRRSKSFRERGAAAAVLVALPRSPLHQSERPSARMCDVLATASRAGLFAAPGFISTSQFKMRAIYARDAIVIARKNQGRKGYALFDEHCSQRNRASSRRPGGVAAPFIANTVERSDFECPYRTSPVQRAKTIPPVLQTFGLRRNTKW